MGSAWWVTSFVGLIETDEEAEVGSDAGQTEVEHTGEQGEVVREKDQVRIESVSRPGRLGGPCGHVAAWWSRDIVFVVDGTGYVLVRVCVAMTASWVELFYSSDSRLLFESILFKSLALFECYQCTKAHRVH